MTGVNTLFNALLNNKEFQQLDFLRCICQPAADAGANVVAERWVKLTELIPAGRLQADRGIAPRW